MLKDAASAAGWNEAKLVVDRTHHTDARRWYIVCCKQKRSQKRENCVCRLYSAESGACVQCALLVSDEETKSPQNSGSFAAAFSLHRAWVAQDHIKRARSLIRRLNHDGSVGATRVAEDNACSEPATAECSDLARPSKKRRRKDKKSCQTMTAEEKALASMLRERFGSTVSLDELKAQEADVLAVLHEA